ncbi:MAG TPA: hypothetical protein VIP75_08000 [Acidothermales bacterium]
MKQPRDVPARPPYNPKVVLLALVPIAGFLAFNFVRRVDNTALQAILTCVMVGLMILAIALIARSQLGAQGTAAAQESIPDADRAVLDSLEPLREDDPRAGS